MARKFLKRYLPDHKKIRANKHLKIFGGLLDNPSLWHLNRHGVIKAVTIGLFVCYIPSPGHMLTAALLAIFFHANLPIALALVWISNPITIPLQFYFGYKVGAFILHAPPHPFYFELSVAWFTQEIMTIGIPMIVGSLLCGAVLAVIGNFGTRLLWRCSVSSHWKKRKKALN